MDNLMETSARNKEIVRLIELDGVSTVELAEKLGISRQRVHQIYQRDTGHGIGTQNWREKVKAVSEEKKLERQDAWWKRPQGVVVGRWMDALEKHVGRVEILFDNSGAGKLFVNGKRCAVQRRSGRGFSLSAKHKAMLLQGNGAGWYIEPHYDKRPFPGIVPTSVDGLKPGDIVGRTCKKVFLGRVGK